jgi:anti-sigma factor ChrR (cupin superfamily)
MTELFRRTTTTPHEPAKRPDSGTLSIVTETMEWQPGGVEGFWIKPLFEEPSTGQRTWLMKVDAGAFAPMHAHDELEQIFVLEGSFYDQDTAYNAGDYAIRAPHAQHTAGSHDGALVLLVYSS